jgi:hypothetical protein
MAKLIVKRTVRTSGEMEILVDEQKIGVLVDKEPKEFEVAAGEHTLLAKTKWQGSADFTFIAKEESAKLLTISDKQIPSDIPLIFIMLSAIGLCGAKFSILSLFLCVLITVAVCVFYLRTLGTNEQMEVKES